MSTVLTGDEIKDFRLLSLRAGLQMEIKGMMVTRSKSCYSIIKQEFGLKGNKVNVLKQFEDILKEKGVINGQESD